MKKIALAIAVTILLTAGCGNASMTELKKGKTVSAEYKPTLAVKVTTKGTTATVTITTDLKLSKEAIGQARKPGEGHIHIYLDKGEKEVISEPTYVYSDLELGHHTVNVSLHNNDHTPYDVAMQVPFEIK